VSVKRQEDGTQFEITWTMNENVTNTYLQYREVALKARRSDVRWNDVVGAQGLPRNVTKFLVVNLDADKTYQFRILFKSADESGFNEAMVVESDTSELELEFFLMLLLLMLFTIVAAVVIAVTSVVAAATLYCHIRC
jgi:hypothetical protein